MVDLQQKVFGSAGEAKGRQPEPCLLCLRAAKTKHRGDGDFVVTVFHLHVTPRFPSEQHPTKTNRGE